MSGNNKFQGSTSPSEQKAGVFAESPWSPRKTLKKSLEKISCRKNILIMPVVKLDRIISVSSEDPNYKGENILNNKKWRSKTVGEDQVSIVIQLSKSIKLSAIGNFI